MSDSSSSSSLLSSSDEDDESLPNTADVSTDEDEEGLSSSSSSAASATANVVADEDSNSSDNSSNDDQSASSSEGEEVDDDTSNSSSSSSSSDSANSSSPSESAAGSATSASSIDELQDQRVETSHGSVTDEDGEQDEEDSSTDEDPTEAEGSLTQTEEASETEAEEEVSETEAEEEASETEAEEVASETDAEDGATDSEVGDEDTETEVNEQSETDEGQTSEASDEKLDSDEQTEEDSDEQTATSESDTVLTEILSSPLQRKQTIGPGTRAALQMPGLATIKDSSDSVGGPQSGDEKSVSSNEDEQSTKSEPESDESSSQLSSAKSDRNESDESSSSTRSDTNATSESETVMTELPKSTIKKQTRENATDSKHNAAVNKSHGGEPSNLRPVGEQCGSDYSEDSPLDDKAHQTNNGGVELSKSEPKKRILPTSTENTSELTDSNTAGDPATNYAIFSTSHITDIDEVAEVTPLDDDFFSVTDSKTGQVYQGNSQHKSLQKEFVVSPTKSKSGLIDEIGARDLPLASPLVRHMDKEGKASDELERRQGMIDKMELKSLGDMSELTIDTTVRQTLGTEGVGGALENASNLVPIDENMVVSEEGSLENEPCEDTPHTAEPDDTFLTPKVATTTNLLTSTDAAFDKHKIDEEPRQQLEGDRTKSLHKKSGLFSRIKRGISNVRPSFRHKQLSNSDQIQERVETPVTANAEGDSKTNTQGGPVDEAPTNNDTTKSHGRSASFHDTSKSRSSSFDSNEGDPFVDRKKRFGFFRRGNIQRNYSSFDEESSSILAHEESQNGNVLLESFRQIESNSKIQAASFTPPQVENQAESEAQRKNSLTDLNPLENGPKENTLLIFDSEKTESVTPAFDSSFVGKDEISYVTADDGPVFQDFGFESPFSEDCFSSGKRTHLGTKKSYAGKIEKSKRDVRTRGANAPNQQSASVLQNEWTSTDVVNPFNSFDESNGDQLDNKPSPKEESDCHTDESLSEKQEQFVNVTASKDDSENNANGVNSENSGHESGLDASEDSGGTDGDFLCSDTPVDVRDSSGSESVDGLSGESLNYESEDQDDSASESASFENGDESASASANSNGDVSSSEGGGEEESEDESTDASSEDEVSTEEDGLETDESESNEDFAAEPEAISLSSHSAEGADDVQSTVDEEDTHGNLSSAETEESDHLDFIEVSDFVSVSTDRRKDVDDEKTLRSMVETGDSDQVGSPKQEQQDLFTGFPFPFSAGTESASAIEDILGLVGLENGNDGESNHSNEDELNDTKSIDNEESEIYVNRDIGPDLWNMVSPEKTESQEDHGEVTSSFPGGRWERDVDVVDSEPHLHEQPLDVKLDVKGQVQDGAQEIPELEFEKTLSEDNIASLANKADDCEKVSDIQAEGGTVSIDSNELFETDPMIDEGALGVELDNKEQIGDEVNVPTSHDQEASIPVKGMPQDSHSTGQSQMTVAESFRSNESSRASDGSNKSRKSASRSIFGLTLKTSKNAEYDEDSDGEQNVHNPIMAFATRAKRRLVDSGPKEHLESEEEISPEKPPNSDDSMAYHAEEIEEDLSECHGTTDGEDLYDCSNSLADTPGGPNQSIGFDENGIQASLFQESMEIDDDYTYSKEELDIPTTSGHGLPPLPIPRPVTSTPNESSENPSRINSSTNESGWHQHKPRRGRRPPNSCSGSFNDRSTTVQTVLPTVRVQGIQDCLDNNVNGNIPDQKVTEEDGTERRKLQSKSSSKVLSKAHSRRHAPRLDVTENDDDSAYRMESGKPRRAFSWFKSDSDPPINFRQSRRQKTNQKEPRLEVPSGKDDDNVSSPHSTKKPSRDRPICICCALVLMAIVGITAGIALGLIFRYHSSRAGGNVEAINDSVGQGQLPSTQPSFAHQPTSSPVNFQDLYEILCFHLIDCRVLLVQDSVQGQAFTWLSESRNYNEQTEQELVNRFALATFYYSTGGPEWLEQKGWLSSDSICSWFSSSRSPCDRSGIFHALELDNNNLEGTLPTEIGLLTTLISLSLKNPANTSPSISGKLPKSLGNLKDLELLRLSGNQISGFLPFELGTSANLRSLDLSHNNMEGDIPFTFDGLIGLEYLNVGRNSFTGALPGRFLQSATNLRDLILDDNKFSSFAAKSGSLRNLRRLSLARNDLASFPTLLLELNELEELDLTGNGFDGTIPAMIGSMQGLQELRLSSNRLNGSIPRSIGTLINLQEALDLSSNRLTGSLPVEITNLGRLKRLYINANQLSGSIPSEMVRLNQINVLRLDDNNFSGEVSILLCDLYDFTRALTYADCSEIRGAENCFTYCCDEITGCTCRFETSSSSNDFLRCLK